MRIAERYPGVRLKSLLDGSQQAIEHLLVVVTIPLGRQIAGRIFQPGEEVFSRRTIESDQGPFRFVAPVFTEAVNRDPPEPRTKRALALTFEMGDLSEDNEHDLLRKIVSLVAKAGHAGQPTADQLLVDVVKVAASRQPRAPTGGDRGD